MKQPNELEKVYNLMTQVSTAAAAAPAVTAPMASVTPKIIVERVRHIMLEAQKAKALLDAIEVLKKINKIKSPDFKKHRLQDPHRQVSQSGTTQTTPIAAKDPEPTKITQNIPHTTNINPGFPTPPKKRT